MNTEKRYKIQRQLESIVDNLESIIEDAKTARCEAERIEEDIFDEFNEYDEIPLTELTDWFLGIEGVVGSVAVRLAKSANEHFIIIKRQ